MFEFSDPEWGQTNGQIREDQEGKDLFVRKNVLILEKKTWYIITYAQK